MQTIKRIKLSKEVVIRDLSKPMPPEGFCAICGKKEVLCLCEKYNCLCEIIATDCKWPLCVCKFCLEVNCICENKNE
jgi:hypothetical protein